MSGPKPEYPITLTEAERKNLEELVRAHKSGQAQVMRAKILLNANAHPEWSNQQIAELAKTGDRIVRKWRGRWFTAHSIADAPRSGAPRHFPPIPVRAQVTATACSLPQQSGVSLSRWSHAEIRRRLAALMPNQRVPSSRTVGRWRNRRTASALALP